MSDVRHLLNARVTDAECEGGCAVDSRNVADDERPDSEHVETGNTAEASIERLDALFGPSTPEEREYRRLRSQSNSRTHCLDCEHEYEADEPIVFGKVSLPPYPWSSTIRYWQVTRCLRCAEVPQHTSPHQCGTCGRDVYSESPGFRSRYRLSGSTWKEITPHTFCSDLCASRHYNALQREKRLKNRQKQCDQCDDAFTGARLRSKSAVGDAIERVAKDNPFHPVREYLDRLEWDGGSRLHNWLSRYLGAIADPKYLDAVGTAFLVSAVARIYEPGCQADHMLVFSGGQGIGKTRAAQILGWPWTTDSVPDLHSKDSAIHLQGVWLVEMAELAALRKAEIESTKAFISRRVDRFRPPYGKRTVEVPRQCVFVGTTNETTYLKDPTGNRRFWPAQIANVDLDTLEKDRDKLWAEAVELYRQSAPWYLVGNDAQLAEQEQEHYPLRSEVEQQVFEYLAKRAEQGVSEITTRQVYEGALGLDCERDVLKVRQCGTEVAAAITACGWKKLRVTGRGKARRVRYVLQTENS